MIYFLIGEDPTAKDQKIAEIKKAVLTNEALTFDYEALDAHKLDPDTLQKALLALPAVAKKRLLVVRQAHKLAEENIGLLLKFAQTPDWKTDVICDAPVAELKTVVFRDLVKAAKVFQAPVVKKENVFDVTKAMTARKPTEALSVLGRILSTGEQPVQILGGLLWFWGRERNRVTPERFQKGLKVLQETDLNIKRSRLKPEYALELLVVKLTSLIAY